VFNTVSNGWTLNADVKKKCQYQ